VCHHTLTQVTLITTSKGMEYSQDEGGEVGELQVACGHTAYEPCMPSGCCRFFSFCDNTMLLAADASHARLHPLWPDMHTCRVKRELAFVAPDLAQKQAELRHAQETLGALTVELVDKQRRATQATVELSHVQVCTVCLAVCCHLYLRVEDGACQARAVSTARTQQIMILQVATCVPHCLLCLVVDNRDNSSMHMLANLKHACSLCPAADPAHSPCFPR
jgi:hypothetical protein